LEYVICFAVFTYRGMLVHLAPVEPSIAFILNILVVGALAQLASAFVIWLAQRIAGIDVPHSQQCRLWTSVYVAIASAVDKSALTASLLVLATVVLCPRCWLWFPTTTKAGAKIRVEDLQSIARQTATKIQGKLAALGNGPEQMPISCEYTGEFSDRVRSTDGRTIVKSRSTVKFRWKLHGANGVRQEAEVLLRAANVVQRGHVKLPDGWFPRLRFAELPSVATRSVSKAMARQHFEAVQCVHIGIVKPISEASCYSGLLPGMIAEHVVGDQIRVFILVAHVQGDSWLCHSGARQSREFRTEDLVPQEVSFEAVSTQGPAKKRRVPKKQWRPGGHAGEKEFAELVRCRR
jgi:hypothetical protein